MSNEELNEEVTEVEDTEEQDKAAETDAKPKAKDGLQADLADERKKRHEAEEKLAKIEAERTKAERKAMSETERLKAEYEDTKKLLESITKDNEKLKQDKIRQSLAIEFSLAPKLAKKISGDNEEEMRKDAEELAAFNPSESTDAPKTRRTNDAKKVQGKKVGADKPTDPLRAMYANLENRRESRDED